MNNPLDKSKIDVLTSHLTIGETYFFRDKQIFAILQKEILPDIMKRRQGEKTIRIWSAGCCTGEEPYSIAILLHRLIPDIKSWKISILGTDINPQFLVKAEKAQYKKWSFRATPTDILECYFKKNHDNSYTLIPQIQNMVQFKCINLVEDTYPNITKHIFEMDLIFFHNVLIYFSANQIKRTVHKLTQSLCTNGWLSVTATEIPFIEEAGLRPHRFLEGTLFKKEPVQKASIENTPLVKQKKLNPPATLPPKETPSSLISKIQQQIDSKEDILSQCLLLYKQKSYHDVIAHLQSHLTPLKNDPLAIKEHFQEVCLLIHTYANQGNLPLALEWLETALHADKFDPKLHYLHAALLHDQGNIADAIKSVKKALFIDSNFTMAYLLLGILEKENGNKKAAHHCFQIASNLIDNHLPDDSLINAEEFTVEHLKDLISSNLKNL